MSEQGIYCHDCHYFTLTVPDDVYKSPRFKPGIHGACIGCPNSPHHIEHKDSIRCAWFAAKETP